MALITASYLGLASSIKKIQSVTGTASGTTTTTTLNGVTAGSLLTLVFSYFQATSGTNIATPTDTGGTMLVASAPAGLTGASGLLGARMYYEANAAAGTHTTVVTVANAGDFCNTTLTEWSGITTGTALDVATSNNGTTAQTLASGTTGTTAKAVELSLIGLTILSGAGQTDALISNSPTGYVSPGLNYDGNTTARIGTQHAYAVLAAIGTQSATWTWTDATTTLSQAVIATFKGT